MFALVLKCMEVDESMVIPWVDARVRLTERQ